MSRIPWVFRQGDKHPIYHSDVDTLLTALDRVFSYLDSTSQDRQLTTTEAHIWEWTRGYALEARSR